MTQAATTAMSLIGFHRSVFKLRKAKLFQNEVSCIYNLHSQFMLHLLYIFENEAKTALRNHKLLLTGGFIQLALSIPLKLNVTHIYQTKWKNA